MKEELKPLQIWNDEPHVKWESDDGIERKYFVFVTGRFARMTRKLTSHKVNGLNEALDIKVLDEPDQNGACHEYVITGVEGSPEHRNIEPCRIRFQNGPVLEAGYNGISQEALLAVVEDRLISFQAGPFACRENAIALTKIQEAMMWLQKRTMDRKKRGVEGTLQK